MDRTAPGASPAPEPEEATEQRTETDPWVLCARCGARIAPLAARIAIRGRHEHEFMNPSGIRYIVVCYRTAPGCVGEGERSTVWSWFPGFAWEIELCRGCRSHLGWSFHARSGSPFHALIRGRLRGPG